MGGAITLVADVFTMQGKQDPSPRHLPRAARALGTSALVTRARQRAAARAAVGVTHRGVVEREIELLRERREPRQDIAELVALFVARPLRTARASSPSSSVSHAIVASIPRARSRSPYVRAIRSWNAAISTHAVKQLRLRRRPGRPRDPRTALHR